jgi:hypothetical protein
MMILPAFRRRRGAFFVLFYLFLRFVNIVPDMKKLLLALGCSALFATSLSAQITINKFNALPTSNSVFGRDEVATIRFDSLYKITTQKFDSAGHNWVNANFGGFGGSFTFDTSGSIHNTTLFSTYDSSGFVIMNSQQLGPTDTQRVMLTSPAFSTVGFNTLKVSVNHFYKYSNNDSAAILLASINGTTWDSVRDYRIDSADHGTSIAFATDMFNMGAQYLNKPTVYLRFVYATSDGYEWAINEVKVTGNKYTPGYSFFKPASNHSWDLSNIMYDGGYRYYSRKSCPAPYRYMDSLYNDDLKGMMHTSYSMNYFTVSGIHAWAHLTYDQKISLAPFTGNVLDSMTVPVQPELHYSAGHTKVAYPLTMNTKWGSNFWFKTQLRIEGPTFGIGNADTPVIRYTQHMEKDTVVGWGKMRVKSIGGDVESYVDVLQVKSVITQIDSFYYSKVNVSDTIPGDSLLRVKLKAYLVSTGLGVPANVQNYSKISYMRVGEIHPFVTVFMTNDTFITKVEVHTAHPWPLDISNPSITQEALKVYPNPVSGNVVNLALAIPQDGNWSCEVLNVMGQSVAAQPLTFSITNTTSQVQLPSSVVPGTYYLRITRNGELMTVKPLTIQN